MYCLLLLLAVALVILSPLALELWLTLQERRHASRRRRSFKAGKPGLSWASSRLFS